MFILLNLKDTIRIAPTELANLDVDLLGTIRNELNQKYMNKVIPEQGLVVAIHSVLSHNPPQIFAGDGSAYMRVNFRVVVFKPFESELINGRIAKSDETGIHLTIDFFHNIFVPAANLPSPSHFEDGTWVWMFNGHEYYFDDSLQCRFKVTEVNFAAYNAKSDSSESNETPEGRAHQHGYLLNEDDPIVTEFLNPTLPTAAQITPKYIAPLTITASFSDQGLGPVEWW